MEKELYIKKLRDNTEALKKSIVHLSSEDAMVKRGTSWSVLEILEHVYLSDKVIYKMIQEPSSELADVLEIMGTAKLEHILVKGRAQKAKAPDFLIPEGRFTNIESFKRDFSNQRNAIQNDLMYEAVIIDQRVHKHFALGELTIMDWLNFIVHHTERHILQIKEASV